MALATKHTFGKINGTRVTFVEKGISKDRMEFLKDLLELNGFEVITEEIAPKEEEGETTYNIAVTDMMFNPVIWIYDRRLKTADGHYVTHEYWEKGGGVTKPQYWEYRYA
jgi:hypothetical protein